MAIDKKKEWLKLAEESKGTRLLLQGSQETDARAFQKLYDEQLARAKEFDKQTAIFENFKDNYYFKLRQELESVGMEDCWAVGMSFDNNAKQDDVMVINFSQPPGR